MKKLLSLLLVATIITSTLCVSYFAFDNVDNLSNITTSEPTEKEIETSTISTSDEATTEPSSTDENTTETSTEPSSSISTPDELTRLVTSIKLNRSKVTIDKGRSIRLVATVTPNDADNKALIWKSSNTNIATVNNGYVKAIKTGKATIIVSSSDGSNITAKCDITVVQKATKVTVRQYYHINKPSKKLYKLNAKVYPSDTTDKSLIYRSSNNKVATINRNGQIKAKKYGKATITVINKKSRKSAKCLLIVGQYVSKIKLSKNKVTLNNGKATKLKSKVTNKKAIYKAIQWKSTNTNIAKVNSNGVVKALKRGTCYVIAVAKDGSNKSAKCKVTVRQLVTKLSYNKKTQKAEVYKNKTIKFAVTVVPSNANNKGLTYTSNNEKVATVNSKGVVKGVKAGTVTITAKAKDGSRKAVKLTVKVKNPPVTMHTKMTREQFVSNKKYVDMYCKALNDYFESCGAYIDYNMKYVDEGQWCVISSDMYDDGDSIYDFMVGTVSLWTWRIAYDNMCNGEEWKGWNSLTKEGEEFLNEVCEIGSPNLKTYDPKKMLDKNWNGWKWYCDLIKSWGTGDDYMLHIYVKAEPIKAYDDSIQKVTTVYRIKMYWG
ncbi:Ig-like domain-containing protein [Ruminococcus sp.]|uniref:Ig-like domain-containing protein n=1 Tax=Ruminococcus sp. TaxID=41978 RepID=UPI002E812218|nr:Ig-like domain-containing protein [Ruminococcus sp.]MEE3439310.1 Ig-like domain-containing protein [Ruminococcus sp.]